MSRRNSNETPGSIKATAIILIIFALAVGVWGYIQRCRSEKLIEICTEQTTGIVMDVERYRTGKRRSITQYRVTAFYTVDNNDYSTQTSESSSSKFRIGQQVEINYDPDDPSACYISGESMDDGVVCFIMAGIMLIISVVKLAQLTKYKYQRNVKGQTFEEWQEYQNKYR